GFALGWTTDIGEVIEDGVNGVTGRLVSSFHRRHAGKRAHVRSGEDNTVVVDPVPAVVRLPYVGFVREVQRDTWNTWIPWIGARAIHPVANVVDQERYGRRAEM